MVKKKIIEKKTTVKKQDKKDLKKEEVLKKVTKAKATKKESTSKPSKDIISISFSLKKEENGLSGNISLNSSLELSEEQTEEIKNILEKGIRKFKEIENSQQEIPNFPARARFESFLNNIKGCGF